ncbi:hypothetical protein [uncultured Oscillibacter sp.]|uniref:hypothetical protein n=1 Tax=uncultured Oscillibacter sp. TaxID=876091 RepID=UPI00260BE7A2|nr:hypothetical protein [uncultured Oscillibacter sp.]
MSNREFYQETFAQVRGSVEIRWEDYEMKRRGKSLKWLVTLAAAVALLAALSALAVAANFFGLRDVLLPEKGSVYVTDENGVVIPGEKEFKDFVSLSGWGDTPESRALAEWEAFQESYDPDGAIISEIGNEPTGFEDRYGFYLVYTREMADKLEEIIAKYDLKLHEWMEDVLPETWGLAVGDFFRENVTPCSGYIYENGTFRFDGNAELGAGELKGYGPIEYQFSRSVKGTFDDVALNIGDLSDFEEWGYRTADGTSVTLGLGAWNRSLILADLGDSFVLVNVLTGKQGDDTFSSGAIGREELEELADSFRWSALTPAREPDRPAILAANDRYMEELQNQPVETLPSESEDPLYVRTGIQSDAARDFVLLLAERIEDGKKEEVADLLVYPAQVEVAAGTFRVDSPEAFLPYYDEVIGQNRLGLSSAMTWEPAPVEFQIFSDGSGLASVADGAVWFGLVEDGCLRVFTLQTDQAAVRALGSGEITRDTGEEDLYTALSADEGRAFVLHLAELIDGMEKEEIAGLLAYPAKVTAPGGEWIVSTPEEFLERYVETVGGNGRGTLAADLWSDPEPVLDGGGNLASAANGTVSFDRGEDGELRVLTLRSDLWQWSIQYWGEKP